MFGTYQHSDLRIEIEASADKISESLTEPERLKQWLWPQQVKLPTGMVRSITGLLAALREVSCQWVKSLRARWVWRNLGTGEQISPYGVRFLRSGSIDGFHEWQWGDSWMQSRLEGISLLPLNLGQTLSLLRLKQYLQQS